MVKIFYILILFANIFIISRACKHDFEGFGIHLGAINHFTSVGDGNGDVIFEVLERLYNDLKLRLYRTSYEPFFSPEPHKYDISCKNDTYTCTWNDVHRILNSVTKNVQDYKLFASVWSPPHYMKDSLKQLKPEFELDYYYFLKNITSLIRQEFGQIIELISPVNEPENFVAPWDHTNMAAPQLCRMIKEFNDDLTSACPENSYYWISQIYMNYNNLNSVSCRDSCKHIMTHAYALNVLPGDRNFLKAYYDKVIYPENPYNQPVWQTEVCSTYGQEDFLDNQMDEALDLAKNILNFVGTTCVSRYYYWLSFVNGESGESLIWSKNGSLVFPKKYFVFKHFSLAFGNSTISTPFKAKITRGSISSVETLSFGNISRVFVNIKDITISIKTDCISQLCCTTNDNNEQCTSTGDIPGKSVCSCLLIQEGTSTGVKPYVYSIFQNIPWILVVIQSYFSNLFNYFKF